jgi:hypothetical protein
MQKELSIDRSQGKGASVNHWRRTVVTLWHCGTHTCLIAIGLAPMPHWSATPKQLRAANTQTTSKVRRMLGMAPILAMGQTNNS